MCLLLLTVGVVRAQELKSLADEPATATFAFDLGTEGQTADFGTAADYFLSSKVTYGSNLTLKDKNTVGGVNETRFEPTDKEDAAGESNAIRFIIQPKAGYAFTPKSVSFKATRYGTDNGTLDFAWQNPNGTTVTLDSNKKPARNNETTPYTSYSYDITGATPAEGPCGLVVYLYGLQADKQIGLAQIVITGVLNGQEKEMPMLGSFTVNGVTYQADDVFQTNGEQYMGSIELSKTVAMVSASNPLTSIQALAGEVGEVTYEGDATQCVVTIPMTRGDQSVNYVLTVVQKPDFTLTYMDTDGTVMGTQAVEKDAAIGAFAVDFNSAKPKDGYKVRGWFQKSIGGHKYTIADIITADIKLYAVATEIEVSSEFKKYTFNLTDLEFYDIDHEAFNSIGSGAWHDKQHGWVFAGGDKIELLVGPKANIHLGLCRYTDANATFIVRGPSGNEVGTIAAYNASDGVIYTYAYEGEPGTLTLEMSASGAVYLHSVRIVNTASTNYTADGRWYTVKPGDASSLLDAIEAVNGTNSATTAERSFVFLPNGTYDLRQTVLTSVSGKNISFIGESQEGVVIKNAPERETEGIGTTAVFLLTGQNLYFQDITLKNALDYYGALGAGQAGGRAVCIQDKGNRSVFKNVTLLSYQDTYYSNNDAMKSYWEDSDIHGTVDFICGGGDVRFVNTTLSLEPREANGTGGRTITAPTTTTQFGYVFDNCRVVDLANGKGDWNFGRTWQNSPICVYLNTTLDDHAKNTLVKSRWTQKGMNSKDPKVFGEYATKDMAGNDITPASNIINSHGGSFQTILTAEEAAAYTYEKMFTSWDPAALTAQMTAPANVKIDGGQLTWDAVEGAAKYLIERDGVFVALADAPGYAIDGEGNYTVRAANAQGGFGLPSEAATTAVKTINSTEARVVSTAIYSVGGVRQNQVQRGTNIVVKTLDDGQRLTEKVITE